MKKLKNQKRLENKQKQKLNKEKILISKTRQNSSKTKTNLKLPIWEYQFHMQKRPKLNWKPY